MTVRALNAAEQAHLKRAAEYIAEAQRHHEAAVAAHDKVDDRALAAAHRSIGRSLVGAQRCFRDLAALGAAADIKNTQTVQTSSGSKPSTGSADGRGSSSFHVAVTGVHTSGGTDVGRATRLAELNERRRTMNSDIEWLGRVFGVGRA